MKSNFLKSSFFHAIILFVVICVTYSNSLDNAFMIDDHGLILQDTKIHNIKNLYYQFIPDQQKYLDIESGQQSVYYRPFAHILPMACYLLFGENVVGYHAVNLILFYVCVLMLYFLIKRLFNLPELAFLTSLLYAVHPLNGMFVNYITASVFSFQIIALAAAFILFLKALDQDKPILTIILSMVLYVVGLFCHEVSFIFPFFLLMTVVVLKRPLAKKVFVRILPYFIFSVFYFLFRLKFAGLQDSILNKVQAAPLSTIELLASNFKMFIWYLSKFFYFDGIVLKKVMQPVTTGFWIWFVAVALLIPIGLYWVKSKDRLKLWGFCFFILGYGPVFLGSSFELQHGLVFEPHWTFFSSLGMFLILSSYLLQLQSIIGSKKNWIIIVLVVSNMMFCTRQLNKIWGSETDYCRYWLKHCPGYKGAMFFLASELMKAGEYDEAREMYKKTLANDMYDWGTYVNLGLMEKEEGNVDAAIAYYKQALNYLPSSMITNNNLGVEYMNLGEIELAKQYFTKAIEYNRYALEPRLNLADLYIREEKYEEALKLYLENLVISPRHELSLSGELEVYILLGQNENFLKTFQHIIQQPAFSFSFYFENAILLAKKNYTNFSLPFFEKALQKDPRNVLTYIELGKLFANMNQWDNAITIWREGLHIDSNNQELYALIKKAEDLKNGK